MAVGNRCEALRNVGPGYAILIIVGIIRGEVVAVKIGTVEPRREPVLPEEAGLQVSSAREE